jgi:hypothetical protein
VAQADERLEQAEGHGLERLVAQLYEERSRLGVGDFALTQRIDGYWDRNDTELDLVAVNEDERVIRFGTSKRNAEKLPADLPGFAKHVERFLAAQPRYRAWRVERVALAPAIGAETRRLIEAQGVMAQDLDDLIEPLT